MDIRKLIATYQNKGLSRPLASARVCQDIILKAIADGPLNRNVTIKGGVVMSSITNNNRRATRDIDLDFIHYSLSDDSIKIFVKNLNVLDGLSIEIEGEIEELHHQDYNGKGINIKITDDNHFSVVSKMDIGVHKHFDIEQEEFLFDVCMSDNKVCLLKNSAEQSFTEKLRSLLKFGHNSRRYKDFYDLYYLKDIVDTVKLDKAMEILIFSDAEMRENNYEEVLSRISKTFDNKKYLSDISNSWQRWIDGNIEAMANEILLFLSNRTH